MGQVQRNAVEGPQGCPVCSARPVDFPPLQTYMESICFVLLYSCLFLSCLVGFSLRRALAIELRLASNWPSACLLPKGKNCGHVPLSPGHPGHVGCVYHCVS